MMTSPSPRLKQKKIVIISYEGDAHITFVAQHLGIPYVTIDPISVPNGNSLSFGSKSGQTIITYKGEQLKNVIGVWYRKPQSIDKSKLPVPENYREYSYSALQQFIELLRGQFEDALWVSDYYAIQRARNKVTQLAVAKQVGFRVPDALTTSDENDARSFVNKYGVVIVKPLASIFPVKNETKPLGFFATKINPNQSLNGLAFAPAIFQQLIDAVYDIRVTVVGDKVFSAVITNEGTTSKEVRDWRLGHVQGKIKISAFDDLPRNIAAACIAHQRAFGLNFSAIDLVMDKKGQFWFLENNPNGQWAFVEEETGQPIGKAIAQLLMSSDRS
ncbi:MAG TPA: hypothetical protein VNX65_03735 [Patescibacteria group bacterium]|jgi:glutathione synthase/RimK-type ligase-like ATP-grasp enzyme|nr:hypothetical protein [Patescibacteria group bacterium]